MADFWPEVRAVLAGLMLSSAASPSTDAGADAALARVVAHLTSTAKAAGARQAAKPRPSLEAAGKTWAGVTFTAVSPLQHTEEQQQQQRVKQHQQGARGLAPQHTDATPQGSGGDADAEFVYDASQFFIDVRTSLFQHRCGLDPIRSMAPDDPNIPGSCL